MREDPGLFAGFDDPSAAYLRRRRMARPGGARLVASVLGRDVYDTYFQTETGGIVIANRPGLPIRPGSMGQPVDDIQACVVDDAGSVVPADAAVRLTLRTGWPSMCVDYLGDSAGYRGKFRGGRYDTGDAARRDDDGYFWFGGRNNDIVNTAGHLVGPSEVESALLECPEVAECAAIRVPDVVFLEKVAAFVV